MVAVIGRGYAGDINAVRLAGIATGVVTIVVYLPILQVGDIESMRMRPAFAVTVQEDDLGLKRRQQQRR